MHPQGAQNGKAWVGRALSHHKCIDEAEGEAVERRPCAAARTASVEREHREGQDTLSSFTTAEVGPLGVTYGKGGVSPRG